MRNPKQEPENEKIEKEISLSSIMTGIVTIITFVVSVVVIIVFARLYKNSIVQNAITTSNQAVVQAKNAVADYMGDIVHIMELIEKNMSHEERQKNQFFQQLTEIYPDIAVITVYDKDKNMIGCWSGKNMLKENPLKNLSVEDMGQEDGKMHISKLHVESLLYQYYPWVVTISKEMKGAEGEEFLVCMDISFSGMANYVDDVGIGQHGYCFIMDRKGNIIYHPQQQLIYSGLKGEDTKELMELPDGSYNQPEVIYTINSLSNCDWRIVGVSYGEELITSKVKSMFQIMMGILMTVLFTAFFAGYIFSRFFTHPANQLARAMAEFERSAKDFYFKPVGGTSEISALSDSFDHMVVQIQELMEQVKTEEKILRKTELNALQTQINPHFLYNTLDSIAWMCEEERSKEAEEMVNALARLFRISISRGHELIPLEKEMQHAESYLKIQQYRYKQKFTYRFEVEDDCLHYLCNKITLQPMIENAIVHGLDMVDEGRITIHIGAQGEDIVIMVADNGIGMTEEQCGKVLKQEPGDKTGIGIKNVNDRIKIYFGDNYGLTIKSELDVGTRIMIRIPKILEDAEYR